MSFDRFTMHAGVLDTEDHSTMDWLIALNEIQHIRILLTILRVFGLLHESPFSCLRVSYLLQYMTSSGRYPLAGYHNVVNTRY